MRFCHTSFRVALLGSALAAAALIQTAGASQSSIDMERTLAATGKNPSAERGAAIGPILAKGWTYSVVHNFTGTPDDGQVPTAEPTLESSNIYGVTLGGGANSEGTLYEISSGGAESLLHSFGASDDGTQPDGAVIFDKSGNMYGTTEYGGASGNGTIWEYSASGTYSVLASFASDQGNFIRGRLVEDKKGNFYGTALFGGANSYGSVFEYSSKGVLTVLHSFDGTDGEFPEHGVVMDKAGNLYGVTAFGGTDNHGTVYEISNNGTFTSLYSFTGGDDGGFLYGGLGIDKQGNLYGSTVDYGAHGYGTVFEVSSGTLTTLYSFTGGADGGAPEGDTLVAGKNLYGAATDGGANGDGGVYEVTPKSGTESLLASYPKTSGDTYSAGVAGTGKTFYGTTESGGTDGDGVVFSLTK
ncbi:MAG TPA: choice-of-anchor tandem repeat GloVer-containing protein [Rhizomicrobium sp.]|nr:choice-of-anchor tandem repeat GloVer-containing protein [Rhizomicrobium sp.]